MTYSELLQSPEWKEKRGQIISRDKNECQQCHNKKIISDFRRGIIDNFTNKYDGYISIKEFDKQNYSIIKIPKSDYILLQNETIIIFEEKNNWCNIIGIRSMTKTEKTVYIASKKQKLAEFLALLNSFNVSNGTIVPHNNIVFTDKDKETLNPENVKNWLSQPISEIFNNDELTWNSFKGLHVHHKYYQLSRLPWEYPKEALVTLCWVCHENLHKNQQIPYLDEENRQIGHLTPCPKCFGAGYFPEYNHVQNGICFECNGVKYKDFM